MEEASITCGFQGGPHIRILGLGENLGRDEIVCFQSRPIEFFEEHYCYARLSCYDNSMFFWQIRQD